MLRGTQSKSRKVFSERLEVWVIPNRPWGNEIAMVRRLSLKRNLNAT